MPRWLLLVGLALAACGKAPDAVAGNGDPTAAAVRKAVSDTDAAMREAAPRATAPSTPAEQTVGGAG